MLKLERSLVEHRSKRADVHVFAMRMQPNIYPLILGRADNGTLVSLYQCNGIDHIPHWGDQFNYNVALAFVSENSHVYVQSAQINKIEVSYSYLFDWLAGGSIWIHDPPTEYEPNKSPTQPEPIQQRKDGILVSAIFQAALHKSITRSRRAARIIFTADKPLSFSDWNSNYLVPINDLLTLATNRPNNITQVRAYLSDGTVGKLLYRVRTGYFETDAEPLSFTQTTFVLTDAARVHESLVAAFREVLRVWLEISSSRKGDAYGLLSDNLYEPSTDSTKLIRLTGAVEDYYAAEVGTKKEETTTANQAKEQIMTKLEHGSTIGLTDEEINRLKGAVAGWNNSAPLKECIRYLTSLVRSDIDPLTTPFEERFESRLVKERGYQAHGGVGRRGSKQEEQRLFIEVLTFLLQALLLRDIGLPPQIRIPLFERTSRYNNASIGARRNVAVETERRIAGEWRSDVLVVEDPYQALAKGKPSKDAEIGRLPPTVSEWSKHDLSGGDYYVGSKWSGRVAYTLESVTSNQAEGSWSLSGGQPARWLAERVDIVEPGGSLITVWRVNIEPASNTPDLKEDIVGLRRLALIIDAWLQTYPEVGAEVKVALSNVFSLRPAETNIYPHLEGWPIKDGYTTE